MIDSYTMYVSLSESARLHSEALKPPWWRLRARWHWRRHQRPIDVELAYRASLVGEVEPLRRFGVAVVPTVGFETYEEGLRRRWLSIIEQVRKLLT